MSSVKPTIVDPFCDESRPVKAIYSDITEARQKIQQYVKVTQCTVRAVGNTVRVNLSTRVSGGCVKEPMVV